MPIAANCPSCGGAIRVADNLAGRKVKCPKCAAVITVPAAEGEIEAIQEAPPRAPAARPPSEAPPPVPRQSAARARQDDADDWSEAPSERGVRLREPQGGTNGLAIAGMVLGIVGFLVAFVPCIGWVLGVVLGILGATLSGIGLASAGKLGSGKGMAIAGLVLSILAIFWGPLWFFIFVGSAAHAVNVAAQQAMQKNGQIVIQDKGFVFQPAAPQGPPTPPSGKLTLNNGQATLQGTLAANDPRDRSRPASVCKVFTIDMVAGKTYQIDMIKTKEGLDPYLRLEDPAGNQVAQDDDAGGNLNARLVFVCPANGEYRIVATTFVGGMGDFTLQVSQQ